MKHILFAAVLFAASLFPLPPLGGEGQGLPAKASATAGEGWMPFASPHAPAPASVVLAAEPAPLPSGDTVIEGLAAVLRGMEDVVVDVEIHTGEKQASGHLVLAYVKERKGNDEKVVRKYILATRAQTAQGPATVRQVYDGAYLWKELTLTDTGEVKVVRQRVNPDAPVPGGFGVDWRKVTDSWRQKYLFKVLRADAFDGEPVYVVDATLKPGEAAAVDKSEPAPPDRMTLFVSKRDCFPRKVDLYSSKPAPDGTPGPIPAEPSVSVRLLHVKLNEGLKPGTFDYKIPPGADVELK